MNTQLVKGSDNESPGPMRAEPVRDASGYEIYAQGDIGRAHTMAHRALDEGRIEQGHRELGAWLAGRHGSGSRWAHLQFHMAVFELALDDWDAAYERFIEHLLPAVAAGHVATDAPALLWRLSLSRPDRSSTLPWQAVRRAALANLSRSDDAFVELHHLLALAGARDSAALEHWLQRNEREAHTPRESLVYRMGTALHAYARRAYDQAAALMAPVLPELARVGGSRAQNGLWAQLEQDVMRRAFADGSLRVQLRAA